MTYFELKDKESQNALEKALPGFKEALQKDCKDQLNDPTNFVNVAIRNDKGGYECVVGIKKNAILVKETYDPNKWNNYLQVTPPDGVLMRIEGFFKSAPHAIVREAARYQDNRWILSNTYGLAEDIQVTRFRPWDND